MSHNTKISARKHTSRKRQFNKSFPALGDIKDLYTKQFLFFLLCVVFIFVGISQGEPTNPEWRQVLVRDSEYATYPSISFGGQHPHSIDVCKNNPAYGAMCIDVGSVRTFSWDDNGITVTYPELNGLYAPYGQSIKVHPDDYRILLYAGDNVFWNYTSGAVAGVYRSTDFGDNWTKVLDLSPNFAITYPISNQAKLVNEKRRGNHDNFAVDPSDSTHWFWQRNQLYYIRIALNSISTAPRFPDWDKDDVTARDIVEDTTTNAWMLVTDADVGSNWIEGIVNYDAYYTGGKAFTATNIINALKKGGDDSTLSPGNPTITNVSLSDKSNWLYESTDSGVTWAPATGSLDTDYWFDNAKGIKFNSDGSLLYIYNSRGLFTYNPSTNNLAAIGDLPSGEEVRDFVIDPHDGTHMLCTIGTLGGGLYESVNSGTNWSKIVNVGGRAHCVDISPDTANNIVFFQDGAGHEWYSADGGHAWNTGSIVKDVFDTRVQVPTGADYRTCAVKYHPTDGNKLYAYGSAAVWYSHDGGETWDCANNYTGAAIYTKHCFGFAAGDGDSWGAGIADYYGAPITHDNSRSFIFGGYNEYKDTWAGDGAIIPAMSSSKYSMNITFHPSDADILIAGFGSANQSKFAKSTDGGQTFTIIDKTQSTNKNYWTRWSAADTNKIYLGSMYSDDGGTTLKNINETGLAGTNYQFHGMDGSDNNKVWALAYSNPRYIAYSSNGGETWTNFADQGWTGGYVAADLNVFEIFDINNLYGMCGSWIRDYYRDLVYTTSQPSLVWDESEWVTTSDAKDLAGDYDSFGNCIHSMAVDPRNKDIIYILLRTNGIDKIWRSTNHGVNWTSIQGNLSRARIEGIAVKPDTGEVLVGGQLGFWVYPSYDSTSPGEDTLWETWGANGTYAPIANAGPDQTVTDTNNDDESVTFNGSGSTDSDGTINSYVWTDNLGDTIPDGVNPTAALSIGIHTITLTVTDNDNITDTDTVTITVYNGINTAPVLSPIGSKSGTEGVFIEFTANASDGDVPANVLTFSLENSPPAGASIDSVTGHFTWTPTESQGPNTYNVTVRVTDDATGNLYDEEIVTITVSEVNASPTLSTIGNKSINEGTLLTFTASASDSLDVPANSLTFSLVNAPVGANINSGTGVFAWTPIESQGSNSYNVTIRVTDNGSPNLYDEETINITVNETNTTPTLDPISDNNVNVGSQITFTATATDVDVPANGLTFSLTTAPAGASINSGTGVFTWTPGSGYEQTFNVTVRVTDDGAGTLFDEESMTITVGPDITPPTVTILSPVVIDTHVLLDAQVPINSLISFTVADSGIGVNLDTVIINVDGNCIYHGGNESPAGVYNSTAEAWAIKGLCRQTGTIAAYSFFFQADAEFDYEQNITVTVDASDLASTSNDMAEQTYIFDTVMREFGDNARANSYTESLVSDRPATARDSDGNIWAVWDQTTVAGDTDVFIGKLILDDIAFGSSVQITGNTNNQLKPVIGIDTNDNFYVAWQENSNGKWGIFLSTSTDNGATFGSGIQISDPNSNQSNPAIAVDGLISDNNIVYVTWQGDSNGNDDIFIASSADSFADKTQITSDGSDQTSPAVAIDAADKVYVVWADDRNASSDIYGADSAAGPWTNIAIVNDANSQSSPAIATEASGTILHLVWVDDTNTDNDVFYGATAAGLTGVPFTGTNITDDSTNSEQINPSISMTGTTADSDLRLFACWEDQRNVVSGNGDTDIYYAETALGASNFGTNILVNDDSATSSQSVPVINADHYGDPYLVWADSRDVDKNIYYAGAVTIGPALNATPNLVITIAAGGTVEIDNSTTDIDSDLDVRIVIPASALPTDSPITISEMINPPIPPTGGFGLNYEFGPSGLVFSSPVTVYLPHAAADCPGYNYYRGYWYSLELFKWEPTDGIVAQHGIDQVTGIHYVSFPVDHFTAFAAGGGNNPPGENGGGGGGGCSISSNGQGTFAEFILPYICLATAITILKLKDRRKRKMQRIAADNGC